ncbi:MAG TPA: lamin tail domain-containing protein, partial [Verrucomicrobiae bacterium]|nr:lamin tail domain-containing protein [Verrucomicrobiae bacterium]
FIELYNPNDVSFDLSDFSLQTGTTTLHEYTFPAGTSLPSKSYTAYYSAITKLSLSNSGGQVKLLDPYGNAVYATAAYDTANDGLTWALANGNWYWTTKPTAGAGNVMMQPPAQKSSGKQNAAAKAKSSKSKTAKLKSKKLKATKTKATLASNNSSTTPTTPIHASILALVAGLALLYGAYEYRTDIKNRVYQLRRYFRVRAADRL